MNPKNETSTSLTLSKLYGLINSQGGKVTKFSKRYEIKPPFTNLDKCTDLIWTLQNIKSPTGPGQEAGINLLLISFSLKLKIYTQW